MQVHEERVMNLVKVAVITRHHSLTKTNAHRAEFIRRIGTDMVLSVGEQRVPAVLYTACPVLVHGDDVFSGEDGR